MTVSEQIEKQLFALQDETYRSFQSKLMPDVPFETIIGVRTPELRKLAKQLAKVENIEEFLADLPHPYYDENNLHGFILSEWKDYDKTLFYLNKLLPYVDNWATCDLISPKSFRKNKEKLLPEIDAWLSSDKPFTIRFGIEMLMSHFLDEGFDVSYASKVSKVQNDEYYVNMMIAWYFATALAKQWDSIIPFLQNNTLSVWVHNKTIRKAIESYRITDEQKTFLRMLKRD